MMSPSTAASPRIATPLDNGGVETAPLPKYRIHHSKPWMSTFFDLARCIPTHYGKMNGAIGPSDRENSTERPVGRDCHWRDWGESFIQDYGTGEGG